MIEFIGALYNESDELGSLIQHIKPYVDKIHFVNDGSTDDTLHWLRQWAYILDDGSTCPLDYKTIEHTGLPETVKAKALSMCQPDSWVIMLDADERFAVGTLEQIVKFINSEESKDVTHVWFTLFEYIDGIQTKVFQKCRLFRAYAAHFSERVHEDDLFDGSGANFDWIVIHRKSSSKQVARELEYLETYRKLLDTGAINQDRVNDLVSNHYFVKVPHG